MMKVSIAPWKKIAYVLGSAMIAAMFLIAPIPAHTTTDDGTAALYKSKCFACHGSTAEKKFDATKADDVLTTIVLKGKKVEKPPHMPGYEEKGMTADQASALVAFMKAQKR